MSSEQLNGPASEYSSYSTVKDDIIPKETAQLQRQHSSDKPPPPGASPPVGFPQPQQQQQRPLIRTDSRAGFQPRIPFQSPQVRPQVRHTFGPPGTIQPGTPFPPRQPVQGPGPGIRSQQPPFQSQGQQPSIVQGPPQSQPRPVLRPQTPFPRQPAPGQGNNQTQKIFQQRSVPTFGRTHIPEEGINRSQTLDSAELEYSRHPPDDNRNTAGLDYGNKTPSIAAINNRSYSLSSNAPDNQTEVKDEARRRSTSSVDSLGDVGDNLERRNEESSSRPTSRMNKIIEDECGQQSMFQKNAHRNGYEDHNASRPDSRSSSRLDKEDEMQSKQTSKSEDTPNSSRPQSRPESRLSKKDEEKPHKPAEPAPRPESRDDVRGGRREDEAHQDRVKTERQTVKPAATKHLDLGKPPKAKSPAKKEGDNDSGVDESTQGNEVSNGDRSSRKINKTSRTASSTPARSLSRGSKSPSLKSPDSNATTPGSFSEKKKVPMNKVQVGSAPSPNLKVVKSKIGSLANASYKPGGGNVKIETKKLEFKAAPRIEAKNDKYQPKGGEKKIVQQKLQWNAKSKINSLENAHHKPKGGEKKIETVKLDFKGKAKPKVGSKDNIKYQPGGGDIKIETKKIDLNVSSKIGSMDNVKHKPGGGDKKIFDDKEYLKQMSAVSSIEHSLSGSQVEQVFQHDLIVVLLHILCHEV
ncbi:unnamed protein product [Acanthoscelides obtectus]|uniref:Microtubule-associated protein n=1 Tax=Acanthoscelides obtectus TaxID=200917 RepID=A0A9P0P9J1_ACAOB|nr:unnamed protein product [Acanthoscelides obtectus]CAK1667547.1 Microtubule-associated protein 2 [Acanthoscelides obtectus]